MPQRPTGQVRNAVNSLADLDLSAETLDSILGHIGRIGVETMDGWDAAATTLVEGDQMATYGSTDERIASIDQSQYETRKGPCVDTLNGKMHYFDGTLDEPRYRQFAQSAADAGIYSVASFPLTLGGEVMGALNFYSPERDALRAGQREEGLLFAGQAAVALANAKAFSMLGGQVEQLEEALQTRTLIGQATGLLMAQEGLTSEEAFQKLVRVSQNANVKLREVAQRYVTTWEEKASAAEANA